MALIKRQASYVLHVYVCSGMLTLCDPMDCIPPGSSVHGIFEARIAEWAAISFSEGSSWPTDWTHVSCIGRWILHHWATWEAHFATWMFLYFGSCQYFPTESNLSWHNMPYPVATEVHLYFQSSESAQWALMNLSRQFLNFWHWSTVTLTVVKLSSR